MRWHLEEEARREAARQRRVENEERADAILERFAPLLDADDVPACRRLAAEVAPSWPDDSLALAVANHAMRHNSLRLLQHQLGLPEGSAEAAAAGRLPQRGSHEQPRAPDGFDPLFIGRDPEAFRSLQFWLACIQQNVEEPTVLLLLAAGIPPWHLVPWAVRRRQPAMLHAALQALTASEVPQLVPTGTLCVPCGDHRQAPYNQSPALILLGRHAEQVGRVEAGWVVSRDGALLKFHKPPVLAIAGCCLLPCMVLPFFVMPPFTRPVRHCLPLAGARPARSSQPAPGRGPSRRRPAPARAARRARAAGGPPAAPAAPQAAHEPAAGPPAAGGGGA